MSEYSFWLRPTSANFDALSDYVAHFAHLFGTEIFEPHMTLIGDINIVSEDAEEKLLNIMTQIGEEVSSFTAPIIDVRQEEYFFRSFYLAFALVKPLQALKKKAATLIGQDEYSGFMPHISLAYGIEDGDLKRMEIEKLKTTFDGLSMSFDRLVLVTSSAKTPIKDWQVKHSLALSPVPS